MLSHKFLKCISLLALTAIVAFGGAAKAAESLDPLVYYLQDGNKIFWQYAKSDPNTGGVTGAGNGYLQGFPGDSFGHICATLRDRGHLFIVDNSGIGPIASDLNVFHYRETSQGLVKLPNFNVPVRSDPKGKCMIAANVNYLYIGTDKSQVFSIDRKTFAASVPPLTVAGAPAVAMTSDDNYVSITQMRLTPVKGLVSTIIDINNKYKMDAPPAFAVGVVGK